jgi:transcriptional regulator with XRE-family HTH domain
MPANETKSKETITDALKRHIKASGLTHYRFEKETGIDASVLDRFMAGKRGISLETAAKIAQLLNLELRERED